MRISIGKPFIYIILVSRTWLWNYSGNCAPVSRLAFCLGEYRRMRTGQESTKYGVCDDARDTPLNETAVYCVAAAHVVPMEDEHGL